MRIIYRVFILTLVVNVVIQAQADSLKKVFNDIGNKYGAKSMTAVVVKDGNIVFKEGFGKRNIALNLPVNPDSTKFRIASISKMIAATALMKLVEENKVKLDEDISVYLGFSVRNPKFPNNKITVRMVASHTAGILDIDGAYDTFINDSYAASGSAIPSLSQLLTVGGKYYNSSTFSSKSPGSYFNYANIDYVIIGTLIEKVSGIRFDKYCKDNLLTPLGIDADFNPAGIINYKQIATLYRNSGAVAADDFSGNKPVKKELAGYQIGSNGSIYSPQGGLRISSVDLSKLMLIYLNKGTVNGVKILNEATVDTMLKSVFLYNGSNGNTYYDCMKNYAIGNFKTSDLISGLSLTGHFGEAYGLVSDMFYNAEKKIGIIIYISGSSLPIGSYSGWYKPEEEFFTAVNKYYGNSGNPVNPVNTLKETFENNNAPSLPSGWASEKMIAYNSSGYGYNSNGCVGWNEKDLATHWVSSPKYTKPKVLSFYLAAYNNTCNFNLYIQTSEDKINWKNSDSVIAPAQLGYNYISKKINLNSSKDLYFKWIAVNPVVGGFYLDDVEVETPTSITHENETPATFSLSQNYPNPFNPSTLIGYQISAFSHVRLNVFDVLGREVATLVDGFKQPGKYSVEFRAEKGVYSSGIYFYTLQNGNQLQTRKMLLIK